MTAVLARGEVALLAALLLAATVLWGREALREEGPPAFFVPSSEGVPVWLGEGFPQSGLHQFSDGTRCSDVIILTGARTAEFMGLWKAGERVLEAGMLLNIVCFRQNDCALQVGWMNAEKRLAMGIPLHPDRMTEQDWQALPQVGPKLAAAIESDRQKNGGFGSLEALDRVPGIGPGRLGAWERFFSSP